MINVFNRTPKPNAKLQQLSAVEIDAAVMRVEAVARLMDNACLVPGTNIRMGLDSVIGLVPVIGDFVSALISSYVIWEAKNLGVSRFTLARMSTNVAIDTVIGAIPILGDAFDVAFRSNLKNLALLKRHLEKHGHTVAELGVPPRGPDDHRPMRDGNGPVIEGTATRID